jgi:uncharacterized membrane protein YccC
MSEVQIATKIEQEVEKLSRIIESQRTQLEELTVAQVPNLRAEVRQRDATIEQLQSCDRQSPTPSQRAARSRSPARVVRDAEIGHQDRDDTLWRSLVVWA